MSSLTTEELRKLLDERLELEKSETKSEPEVNVCQYKSIRAGQKQCENEASTTWGFCKKHGKTVQSRRAKKEYQEKLLDDESVDDELSSNNTSEDEDSSSNNNSSSDDESSDEIENTFNFNETLDLLNHLRLNDLINQAIHSAELVELWVKN